MSPNALISYLTWCFPTTNVILKFSFHTSLPCIVFAGFADGMAALSSCSDLHNNEIVSR